MAAAPGDPPAGAPPSVAREALPAGVSRLAGRVARGIGLLARAPRALTGRFRYVLILSHMRGYTSLLAHILGSHPEVSGYFELHQGYRRSLDLVRMRLSVTRGLDGPLRGQYVLDKIVHSRYEVARRILEREDVFTVFMLRRPLATIASAVDVRRFSADPEAAARYYVERVGTLANTAAHARNAAYLDAEALLSRTEPVLESLRSYLGLESALSPAYSTFRYTGRRGFGDWSDALKGGEIVRARDAAPAGVLPACLLGQATAAYDAARSALLRHCRRCG